MARKHTHDVKKDCRRMYRQIKPNFAAERFPERILPDLKPLSSAERLDVITQSWTTEIAQQQAKKRLQPLYPELFHPVVAEVVTIPIEVLPQNVAA